MTALSNFAPIGKNPARPTLQMPLKLQVDVERQRGRVKSRHTPDAAEPKATCGDTNLTVQSTSSTLTPSRSPPGRAVRFNALAPSIYNNAPRRCPKGVS